MEFEFDPAKSATNQEKHGLDFVAAQALWLDPLLLDIPARLNGEPRMYTVGVNAGKVWVAVWTHRATRVRIISVRRARKDEVESYEDGRI